MAISASLDENSRPALSSISNADGTSFVKNWSDPVTHRLLVDAGTITIGAISGNKTNNAAVPGATNIGTLPAVANAAAPTYTETFQVALSTDLNGNLRTLLGTSSAVIGHVIVDSGVITTVGAVTAITNALPVGANVIGKVSIDQATPGTTNLVALTAETTKVIGTTRSLGNIGAIFDGVNTAATAPANGILELGIYNSTEPSPTTGQSVGIQLDSKGRTRGVIMDAAGNTRGANVNASNQLSVSVDNTVTVAAHAVTIASGGVAPGAYASGAFASGSIASGAVASGAFASGSIASGAIVAGAIAAGATSFVKLEDVASAGGDAGVPAMAIQTATPIDTAAEGDYVMHQMAGGKVWVGADLKQVAGTTIVTGGTAGTQSVGGIVANNGTINSAVNPILVGGQAVSSENVAGTTAKLAQFVTDLVGKLIVLPFCNPENIVSGIVSSAMTGTTSTSCVASPGGSLRNYITSITVSNGSTTVPTDILIQDGNGGTTLWIVPAPIGTGTGTGTSGATLTFSPALRQPTTATAIYVANVTTGSSTKVSINGYKGV